MPEHPALRILAVLELESDVIVDKLLEKPLLRTLVCLLVAIPGFSYSTPRYPSTFPTFVFWISMACAILGLWSILEFVSHPDRNEDPELSA